MNNIPLVLFLGILSTIQTHLAKALERQGIEVFDQLKARLQKDSRTVEAGLKKPVIYTIGVVLNNTLFIWSTLAQPYGPPALFSSMFGLGLVFLMVYAGTVLKERITRRELLGAGAIVLGTLAIGYENILRAGSLDRFTMRLEALLLALVLWLALSLTFIFLSVRAGDPGVTALSFGLLAGGLGSLDPFLKGVGQNYGGQSGFLPSNLAGSLAFGASFVVGFLAFLVTQFGFARKVRASLLVPAYNAAFIGLPVLWQVILLPGYRLTWLTGLGLASILAGVAAMQAVGRRPIGTGSPKEQQG
jgi:drug/metabolite transporter (DMT)-like permease